MWSKLARNSILRGPADAYCLVCETHLLDEQSAELHVSKPVHQKTLDAVGYYEKFKDHLIRKVPCGYYCEACACVSVTAAACSLHVASARHRERVQRRLRRLASGALVCGRRLLAADAWQGLVGDTCVLCCADVTDRAAHITERPHVLKLVQTQLLFGNNDAVYRKVDHNTCHCIICNEIFSADSLSEHFNSADHLNALNKCVLTNDDKPNIDAKDDKTDVVVKIDTEEQINKSSGEENNSKILNSVGKFQKNGVQIDFINEHAHCKKCLVDVKFDFAVIDKHIKEHMFKPKKERTKVEPNKPKTLITKPKSASSQSGNKVSVQEPELTKDNIKVKATFSKESKLRKIPFHKFCDEVTLVETSQNHYIIIMDRYIEFLSYELIVKSIYSGLSCFICNVPIQDMRDFRLHLVTAAHRERIHRCLVVESLDSEFIREPKPGVYHCGFCNEIEDGWESMEDHLQNSEHSIAKAIAKEKLHMYNAHKYFMNMLS